jgi:transposase
MRATRDLLRRRNHFMRKRAELFTHIQNTASQYNIPQRLGRIAKAKNRPGLTEKFDLPCVQKSIEANLAMIETYDKVIAKLERDLINSVNGHDPVSYALLKTIPGVWRIIALNLLYEIENIRRFPRVQDFASYCRLVKCSKESNGKKMGHSGKKIGNAHLRWAFGEAAQLFLKGNEPAQKYHQRIVSKHGKGKALSIISHKLGRAVYYMLKNQVPFDQKRFLTF